MKTAKRLICLLLALTTLLSLVPVSANAASDGAYKVLSSANYARTYTLATTGRTIPYTTCELKDRGSVTNGASTGAYIDNAADELYLKQVGITNGVWWAFVSYPTGGGRRSEAYIPLSAISVNNGTHACGTATGKFYCAPRENAGLNSSYYVARGDQVYLLGTYGSRYQIMYPVSNGRWRIAFCNASDYHTYVSSNVAAVGEGTYVIVSALDNKKAVDINGASTATGANVQLWSRNDSGAQIFRVSYAGGGYYTICNTNSGKCLDVCGAVAKAGTNVQQYPANGSAAQRWCFEDAGGGCFYIRSELGLYLDVSNGLTADGTNIHIWTGNSTNAQRFRFIPKNVSSSVAVRLNVPHYMQTDSRWENTCIGSKTIGQVGCLITSAAMLHSFRTGSTVLPNAMKDKLKFKDNCLIWASLTALGYTQEYLSGSITQEHMADIYSQLRAGRPVILGAYSAKKGYSHWIVITGYTGSSTSSFQTSDFTINDPSDSTRTTLAQFLGVFRNGLDGMVY